ncbi:MAG TPA: AfsR/SARP family transcriptional regulator [Candidatus Limnocylindrales bacterium]
MPLEVRLLGPLEVVLDGRPVRLSGRLRALLAVLALSAGKVVSMTRIAEAVWGEDQPANPRAGVQTYITRLRETLGPDHIHTEPPGYRLSARVDAQRFEELLDGGQLREALVVWRGVPFGGTGSAWLERIQGPRLTERYLAAAERLADLDLAAGRHTEQIAPLRELLTDHPLRESLAARLVTALDRAGRRTEALEVFESTRRRIADELGADPGPELRGLQTALLPDQASAIIPRQLPPDLWCFAGRDPELSTLDEIAAPVAVVTGTAGVGKTTLAVHWAHRVAGHFPDGQLYVNLRGFDPSGSPAPVSEAVRGFLDALGAAPERVPAGVQAQIGMYRSLMADRRMLVLLDNARDADQVRPLLPGAAGCAVIVTSRDRLTGLIAEAGARPVVLDAMPSVQARRLLELRLGTARVSADPWATYQIIDRCAGLPLALAVVAAQAALHPDFALQAIAPQLAEGLDADVVAVFSWSYRTLGPDAARLFRLLGLHCGPDVTVAAAASLAAATLERTGTLLRELAATHLMAERVPGRYTFHDLLRSYAAELAATAESAGVRHAATVRMLEHYAHSAHLAAEALDPNRRTTKLEPATAGVIRVAPESREAAMAWFDAEHPVLMRAVERAAADGLDAATAQLAWALAPILDLRGEWSECLRTQELALAATVRLGDRELRGDVHRRISRCLIRLGRSEDAEQHLLHAMGLAMELGDGAGLARTPSDSHALRVAATPCRGTRSCAQGARAVPGGRTAPRGGDRAQRGRLVQCQARRLPGGACPLPASPGDTPGARQPLRPGVHMGQSWPCAPEPRRARARVGVLPAVPRPPRAGRRPLQHRRDQHAHRRPAPVHRPDRGCRAGLAARARHLQRAGPCRRRRRPRQAGRSTDGWLTKAASVCIDLRHSCGALGGSPSRPAGDRP